MNYEEILTLSVAPTVAFVLGVITIFIKNGIDIRRRKRNIEKRYCGLIEIFISLSLTKYRDLVEQSIPNIPERIAVAPALVQLMQLKSELDSIKELAAVLKLDMYSVNETKRLAKMATINNLINSLLSAINSIDTNLILEIRSREVVDKLKRDYATCRYLLQSYQHELCPEKCPLPEPKELDELDLAAP